MKSNKVLKKTLAIACAASLCIGMHSVFADAVSDAQNKVNNIDKQITDNQQQQSSVQSEAQSYISQIADLDTQIATYESKLSTLKSSQADINEKVESYQTELQNSAQLFNSAEDVYVTRVRAIYENGIPSVFEILVSSKGINDFFARLGVYTSLLEYDQNLIDNMKNQKEYVDYLKTQIDDAKLSLESISYDVEKSTAALETVKAQKEAKVNELKSSAAKLKSVENELKEERTAANNALAAAIEAARPKNTGGNKTYNSTTFIWPTTSSYITAGFGTYYVWGFAQQHNGVDIGVGIGTPVYAAATGTVIISTVVTSNPYGYGGSSKTSWSAANGYGYGNYVAIEHPDGKVTLYGHLSSVAVSSGQTVVQGQVIGYSGSTGNSSGPHLHFEVRLGSKPVNPMSYFN